MPLVVINLGGEMVYILSQRLRAQKIQAEKAGKVLSDVVSAMFSSAFVEELFKPQPLYEEDAMRKVFHELAHASVMRLNETSMSKLHDLMSMGFKYQLMAIKRPSQILDVTCNHIQGIVEFLDPRSDVAKKVKSVRNRIFKVYGSMSDGELARIRRIVMRYFQDYKVKISTFLKKKFQRMDGSFVVDHSGESASFDRPGTVRTADGHESKLKVANAEGVTKHVDGFILHGLNVWYSEDSKDALKSQAKKAYELLHEMGRSRKSANKRSPRASTTLERKIDDRAAQVAKAELNALANLVHNRNTRTSSKKDNFTLDNIFAPKEVEGKKGLRKTKDPSSVVVTFGGKASHKAWSSKLASGFDGLEADDADGGEEDDLLALMDS